MGERLAGKRALVTGSTSGIGLGIARMFARVGAKCGPPGGPPEWGTGRCRGSSGGGLGQVLRADLTRDAELSISSGERRVPGRVDILVYTPPRRAGP